MNEYLVILVLGTLVLVMAIAFLKSKLSLKGIYVPTAVETVEASKRLLISNFGEEQGLYFFKMVSDFVDDVEDEAEYLLVKKINDMIPEDKKIDETVLRILIQILIDSLLNYRAQTGSSYLKE